MQILKQPSWWHHPAKAWSQLCETFVALNVPDIEKLGDNKFWFFSEGGATNFSYRVAFENQSFFVQIIDYEKLTRLPSRQFVPVNKVIVRNPRMKQWLVECHHESELLRVFDWVEAENTSAKLLCDPKVNDELCHFLAVSHSVIGILPILNIREHLNHYFQMALLKKPEIKDSLTETYSRALDCAKYFSASTTCHNDLSPGNVLFSDQLHIVDWEYACISDPIFDLAGISVNFDLDPTQQKMLIQNYSENIKLNVFQEKFNKMKELYQLVVELWSV